MKKFHFVDKNKISNLPKTPGVYAFKRGRKFLYIGKAVNLKNRVASHRGEFVLNGVKYIGYVETKSETDALFLEARLIKQLQPKYNTHWKDDKNYFYVGVTQEPFPRIFITHQPKYNENGSRYVGPFVNGRELKQKLKDLRKTYPYRTCKTIPKKPCLWYHIKQCPAPCILPSHHIEAYDISNIQGTEAAGSMITFINGKPDKNLYRRFKIKTVDKPNDVAMLKEVLSRRLKHKEWPYPNLILIDGGKAQLNAACLTLNVPQACVTFNVKQVKIMALAKKDNKLYIEGQKNPVLLESLPQDFANLILRARDEAHRFARAYHHKLRYKALLH